MNSTKKYGFCKTTYSDGSVVPTLVFGGGNIKVTSFLKNEDDETGVGFSEVKEAKEVGYLDMTKYGDEVNTKEMGFQFMFDNADSIDVVIDALNRAKAELIND